MVLKDHVRKGKVLLPPMLTMGVPVQQAVWHCERLPELFWLALFVKRLGESEALELIFEMTQAIESTINIARGTKNAIRAYLVSEHLSFSNEERELINNTHRGANWLKALKPHLADFGSVWTESPINYLASGTCGHKRVKTKIVNEIRDIIEACFDRHKRLALIIQAIAVAVDCRTGHLLFPRDLPPPDLNAIFQYPETEESRRAAGFVVTACGQLVMCRHGPSGISDYSWQRAFWNACYHLQECEYE